jgi:hypothetical protein
MKTPYHTGKVAIGLTYQPPPPHHDEDALRLQDALLGNRRGIDEGGVFIAAVCILLALVPLIHFWSSK